MSKINYSTIAKRSNAINAVDSWQESTTYTREYMNNLKSYLSADCKDNKISSKTITSSDVLFNSIMKNPNEATIYGADLISVIETIYNIDNSIGAKCENSYCIHVLPYSKSLSSIELALENTTHLNKIKEHLVKYKAADRIIANHEKIFERFNETLLKNNINERNADSVIDEVCSMVDSYNLSPSNKLNSCLEELCYLFDKNGLSYNKKDLVKKVTEYYIITGDDINEKELELMNRALKEGYYVDPKDSTEVDYLFNKEIPDASTISGTIKGVVLNTIALDPSVFHDLAKEYTRIDITNNLSEMFDMLINMESYNKITSSQVEEIVESIVDGIIDGSENKSPVGEQSLYDYCLETIENYFGEDRYTSEYISESMNNLNDAKIDSYSDYNIEAMNYVNSGSNIVSIQEFGKFNFTNLVKAAINMSNYIKAHKLINKTKKRLKRHKFIKKAANVLFGESYNIYDYIGTDCRADICVEQVTADSYEDILAVKEYYEEICKKINEKFIIEFPDIRAYYVEGANFIELHVKDRNCISLTEGDITELNKHISPELENYIEIFANAAALAESAKDTPDGVSIEQIVETSKKLYPGQYCDEAFDLALEALYYGGFNEEDMFEFYTLCTEDEEPDENDFIGKLDNIISTSDEEIANAPTANQEAFDLFIRICEEAPVVKKPKVGGAVDDSKAEKPKVGGAVAKDTDDKDDAKKSSGGGLDSKLNSLKLAMTGLKQNIKDASHKEQEMSKNLDNNVTRLVKSMKDALISDRREAIIKGSVIPSFSKCIKIGIGLAGIGAISMLTMGTVLPAVIVALGGFALSKNLTRKERILLLDDIETELDVIDKEISMAESRNQMKKYRKLLKIKKDLQRQYQRIRYNVRVGKDILPDSAAGVKHSSL